MLALTAGAGVRGRGPFVEAHKLSEVLDLRPVEELAHEQRRDHGPDRLQVEHEPQLLDVGRFVVADRARLAVLQVAGGWRSTSAKGSNSQGMRAGSSGGTDVPSQ